VEAVSYLDANGENELHIGGAAGDETVERLAGDVLHDDVGFVARFASFVDSADVWMLNGGCEAGFAEHSRAHLLGGKGSSAQDFEHDGPLQLRVVGKVDHAASPGAKPADNFVMCDRLFCHAELVQV